MPFKREEIYIYLWLIHVVWQKPADQLPSKGKKKEQIKDKKSVAFLNANNELAEREIKKAIPFIITMKRIKYLGTNLTKEVKDLYTESSKTVE